MWITQQKEGNMEIWKDIKGYEGLYQISNCGNVKSLVNNGKIKALKIHNKGYYHIELLKDGKSKMFLVHRLVAEAFIPKSDKRLNIVNHKDLNKKNNCVENLEWCDYSYNVKHFIENIKKKKGNDYTVNSKNNDTFRKIIRMEDSKIFENSIYLKHNFGYHQTSILDCCRGIRKTAYGYHWQFA